MTDNKETTTHRPPVERPAPNAGREKAGYDKLPPPPPPAYDKLKAPPDKPPPDKPR